MHRVQRVQRVQNPPCDKPCDVDVTVAESLGGLQTQPPMLNSYRDLDVWKRSVLLVAEVYRVTRQLPLDERFGLTAQMRRASVSVTCNIAGYGRLTRGEYLNLLSVARGSLYELEALSEVCQTLSVLRGEDLAAVNDHLKQMRRMLRRLMESLRKKK